MRYYRSLASLQRDTVLMSYRYSAVSNIKRLLDHLQEAAFFAAKDLQTLRQSLVEYRHSVERGKDSYSPHLLTLLEARIDVCENLLSSLDQVIAPLTPDLAPTWEKLVSILRSLSACSTKTEVLTPPIYSRLPSFSMGFPRPVGMYHP